ncbi:type II toxin-antitoxin system RelE/ParE family toxin [Candidatus Peregrinibacteria bacterium]|nr:type II toxin-antitoxin system RelE/ParE family toxin [Candidatus Peregrinibacteria bacterium]
MEKWKKQLGRIPRNARDRIEAAILLILARDFSSLDRLKLKGYDNIFRVRVGDFRIVYHDDGEEITLKAIPRRDERTYKAL